MATQSFPIPWRPHFPVPVWYSKYCLVLKVPFDTPGPKSTFVQTVVEDEEGRLIICIRGPLVNILVIIAPEYGPCVSTNMSGQKVLLVQCLNAIYGTMVTALILYFKKFVKSLTKLGYKINPYDLTWLTRW